MSYRDDLEAAHARIASLEKQLQDKPPPPPKEKKMRCHGCGGRGRRIGRAVFAATLAVGVLLPLLYVIGNAITNRTVRNCYVESEAMTFNLMREIDWSNDRMLGRYRTMDELMADADRLHCPVK